MMFHPVITAYIFCTILFTSSSQNAPTAESEEFYPSLYEIDVWDELDSDMELMTESQRITQDELSSPSWRKTVYLDDSLARMMIMYRSENGDKEYCFMIGEENIIDTTIKRGVHMGITVTRLPSDNLTSLMNECVKDVESFPLYKYFAIYPGTKYCGAGHVAPAPGIFGRKKRLDRCCFFHDRCTEYIPPRSTNYNLTNRTPYTVSSCRCDKRFRKCLQDVNTWDATIVRYMYFHVLRMPCVSREYPVKSCLNKDWFGRCNKYELDRQRGEKIWQVFDTLLDE